MTIPHSWAAPGVECVCIVDHWSEASDILGILFPPPFYPEFMKQYTIKDIDAMNCGALDCKGDHIMLCLTAVPTHWWSIDGFAPVQKISKDEEQTTKVPELT